MPTYFFGKLGYDIPNVCKIKEVAVMMQLWEKDMVRFMKDASEYGSYNQELAKRIAPYINKETHVCDAGCGLGYLSLALAPYAGKVTGVERHPDAAGVLAENSRRLGLDNVVSRCGAIQEVRPETPYDAMVFCFFGGIDEILEVSKEQCRGRVFIITRNYTTHRFSVGEHSTGTYGRRTSHDRLEKLGIPFEETTLNLEFGQPFRCFEDARRFYETYSKDADKAVITDEFLREKLVVPEDGQYPYYMPHRRELAILTFEAKDIP